MTGTSATLLRRTATVSAAAGAVLIGGAVVAGAAFADTSLGSGLASNAVTGVTSVTSSTSSVSSTLTTAVSDTTTSVTQALSSATSSSAGLPAAPAAPTGALPSPPPLPAPLNQVVSTVTGALSSVLPGGSAPGLPGGSLPGGSLPGGSLPGGGGASPAGGGGGAVATSTPKLSAPKLTLGAPPPSPTDFTPYNLAALHDLNGLSNWTFSDGVLAALQPDVAAPPMLPTDAPMLAAGQTPRVAGPDAAFTRRDPLPGGLPALAVIGATLAVGIAAAAHVGALQQRLARRPVATA